MEYLELLKLLGSQGVLGVVLYVLYRRYDNSETQKNELAKEVIAVILKYEHKTETNIKDNVEIIKLLNELKQALNERNR